MMPRNASYPFYNMPDENYFGEFRELSNSIGHYEDEDKNIIKEKNHNNTDIKDPDDAFNEFSTFPKY